MHIYKITNLVNGKIYIGQTVQKNPMMRWYGHTACARKGKHSHLYNSMRKYGIENFVWQLIDTANCLDDLNAKEKYWLDFHRAESDVYNAREAGGNKLHSAESKLRMQEAQKQAHARRRAEGREGGWKRKDGGPMKGKQHKSETKEKMSRARLKYYGKVV